MCKFQPVTTIDGPAGVGKSTLAALLAHELNEPFLDTGAMFRYLALKLGEEGLEFSDSTIVDICSNWKFSLSGIGANTILSCCEYPIGSEIRTEKISKLASNYAKKAVIRDIMLKAQRSLAVDFALVVEGRDMGTVIFPYAAFKFFLDADPKIRAERRWLQSGCVGNLQEIAENIRLRDEQDRNRAIAPLKPAADALIIDTSNLTIDQVLQTMLDHINNTKLN